MQLAISGCGSQRVARLPLTYILKKNYSVALVLFSLSTVKLFDSEICAPSEKSVQTLAIPHAQNKKSALPGGECALHASHT